MRIMCLLLLGLLTVCRSNAGEIHLQEDCAIEIPNDVVIVPESYGFRIIDSETSAISKRIFSGGWRNVADPTVEERGPEIARYRKDKLASIKFGSGKASTFSHLRDNRAVFYELQVDVKGGSLRLLLDQEWLIKIPSKCPTLGAIVAGGQQ